MLFYNLLLIINELQPSVDFAVRDQREIILKYRKENGDKERPPIGHFGDLVLKNESEYTRIRLNTTHRY